MRKNHSNWREDLREVVDIESSEPETEEKSEVRIGDKKVTNKITINPVMKEAFGQIGALVIEVTELEEGECDDSEKKKRDIENLQNDKDTKEGRKPGKLKEDLGMLQQQRAKREVQTAKIDMKIARERTKTAKGAKTSVQDQEAQQVKEEYKDLPKRKMGMKAGKKIVSAVGHAAQAGTDPDERNIEPQIRMQKAGKKTRQADKIHNVAGKHNPNLSKLKSMKNRLTGMAKESMDVKRQMQVSQDYFKKRASRSPEEKEAEKKRDAEGRAKNLSMHKKPDPYKARAGESD
jgi:hypothetical protein